MRVLIVGAGSVGQVYGYHLAQGGAEVRYLVKPRHLERLQGGMTLYPWNRRDRTSPIRWTGHTLATSLEEGLEGGVDVVVTATSTTAMMNGDWFPRLVDASGDASVLILQPGPAIPAYVSQHVGADRVVWGLISVMAWPAPLPGQDLPEPGQAWWFPWGGHLGFSGPSERTGPIVEVMKRGGAPATARDDIHTDQAFAAPVLSFVVTPLEISGWSMRALCGNRELLTLAHRAMQVSWQAAEKKTGERTPLGMRLLGPGRIAFVLRYLLPLAPVHMETFFRVHYTKIAEQTPVVLQQRIDAIQALGVDPGPVRELRERLLARRAEVSSAG